MPGTPGSAPLHEGGATHVPRLWRPDAARGTRFSVSTLAADARPFDADNHYYEALDAFTRHLDPKIGPRTIQWADIGGRKYHVIAGA